MNSAGGGKDAAIPAARGAPGLLLALSSILGNSAEPIEEDGTADVEQDVRPEDAPIPPLVLRV